MASEAAPQIRSLYRRVLRELPARASSQSILASPSPIQKHVREHLSTESTEKEIRVELQQMEQYVQYIKAQRMYTTLLERYNPGMNMAEEDRVKLTARRVGMDLPDEWKFGKK